MPSYYHKSDYKLIGFEKSKRKNKKYLAALEHKKTGKVVKLHFGDKRYQHFKDSTPLKKFSHLDHKDPERRRRFRQRHKSFLKDGYYSPSYFSYHFLW